MPTQNGKQNKAVAARAVLRKKREPKVASPIYKQSFDLRTGQCLDDARVRVPTYEVRVERGRILVCCQPRAGGSSGA